MNLKNSIIYTNAHADCSLQGTKKNVLDAARLCLMMKGDTRRRPMEPEKEPVKEASCAYSWCMTCGVMIPHIQLEMCPTCGSHEIEYEEDREP